MAEGRLDEAGGFSLGVSVVLGGLTVEQPTIKERNRTKTLMDL